MIRLLFFFFLSCLFYNLPAQKPPQAATSGEIYQGLLKLKKAGSVLYVAAHPDDENTRLLSWLANELLVDAHYISLTRGDGGQNLIGTEQGDLLGMIRTQELLAARNHDKAKQHFSRARDFGYSKTAEETLDFWNKDSILSDLVWVIRETKPQLIINRFPSTGEGGHGHHTASAILAEEAIIAAADPERFSWQLAHVQTWQAKRLLWNAFIRGDNVDKSQFYNLDIGEYNPYLGKSYGEIAAESRTMHKSQGFGSANTRGTQIEYFKHIEGDSTSVNNIFHGVNFEISKVEGSDAYITAVNEALKSFWIDQPHKAVPDLVKAYNATNTFKNNFWKKQKLKEIQALIQQSLGIWFEAISSEKYVVPGKEINIKASIICRSPLVPELVEVIIGAQTLRDWSLKSNETASKDIKIQIPQNISFTTPYWLRKEGTMGLFSVEDLTFATSPQQEPPLKATFIIKIDGQEFRYQQPVIYKWTDPVEGEIIIPVHIVPAVTVNFQKQNYVFRPDEKRNVKLIVKAFDDINGTLKLNVAQGWKASPKKITTGEIKKGSSKEFSVEIIAPQSAGEFVATAVVEINNKSYDQSITEIKYNHVPEMILLKPANAGFASAPIELTAKKIGYIHGAGDDVPSAIEQIGGSVTILDHNNLGTINLSQFDAIVTGIRAYNTNDYLLDHQHRLLHYIENGGTLLVQYNTRNWISNIKTEIGPYPFEITRERVTDETAPVRFAKSDHKILNSPNKITPGDFEGWVQERGLYFASTDHPAYEKILLMNDPGENGNDGSLLIAKHGKGYFIYTGISFFRQLPSGVPGAYRLFANLLSIGK
jgi:LmbE family N-acetylglucosaminyl deacetylase